MWVGSVMWVGKCSAIARGNARFLGCVIGRNLWSISTGKMPNISLDALIHRSMKQLRIKKKREGNGMGRINSPVTRKVIPSSVFVGLMVAVFGLSPFAEARPLTSSLMAVDHQLCSDAAVIRLVDTRDHDEDASVDRSTTEMSTPKKKPDTSMKHRPDAKNQSGQNRKTNEQQTKESQSAPSDEQLSLKEANDTLDRPDDRRQGKNLKRKP